MFLLKQGNGQAILTAKEIEEIRDESPCKYDQVCAVNSWNLLYPEKWCVLFIHVYV